MTLLPDRARRPPSRRWRADHRAAVVGVRQLRHPLQGVRAAGVPRDPYEKIADAAQVHLFTGVAPTVALHIPWDRVDDYDKLAAHAEDLGVALGTINTNIVPGRRLQARLRHPPRPGGPPQGDRPPARVRRHHGRDRLPRPEAVVLRRHQLPGPGRHPRPPGPARRGAGRRSTTGSATTSGCCSSTSSSSRPSTRPTCPTGARRTRTASRSGDRRRSCSTPATTRRAPTSSSSSRCCCARASSARSTSTPASTPTTT